MIRIAATIGVLLWGLLLAGPSRADTRVARDAAPCTLSSEGELAARRFERQLSLQMDYLIHIYAHPPTNDDSSIAGQVLVTNRSQAELYFRCDVAFFAADGRLVGCLSWDAQLPTRPGTRTNSYSFTTARIPKERIGVIASYKAVIYESNNILGTEPVSDESRARTLGVNRPVVIALQDPQSTREHIGKLVEDRTRAACTFREAKENEADLVLAVGTAADVHLRLSPNLVDQPAFLGSKPARRLVKVRRWRLESVLEDKPSREFRSRPGSLYFALLDSAGGLVYSGRTGTQVDFVPTAGLPPDQLFSGTQLDAVLYAAP